MKKSFQEIINKNVPVLIDFYADWCGPCKSMSPILKQLKSELQDSVSIIKINVDTNPSLAAKYQVQGVPTFIVFKNGVQTFRQSGMLSLAQLKQVVST
jgi:thioredoxin 1